MEFWLLLLSSHDHFLRPTDPLPDGAVCQLGLREGRLPDAEVRGHQVEGGAGASRHPLHPLQGAPQRLHIEPSGRPGRATPASLPLSLLLSFYLSLSTIPSRGGADGAYGPSPPLMSLVRHMTMWSGGEGGCHTNLLSHKQHFRWKKKPLYLSHGWCYHYHYGSFIDLDTSCLVLIVVLL